MLVPTHDVVHEELQRLQLIARGACHTRQWHRKPFKVKIFDRTGNEPFWLLSETYAKLIMLPFDLHLEQLDQHSCCVHPENWDFTAESLNFACQLGCFDSCM